MYFDMLYPIRKHKRKKSKRMRCVALLALVKLKQLLFFFQNKTS